MKDNYTREELYKIFGLEQCDLPKVVFNPFKNLNKSFGESNVIEFDEQDKIEKRYLAESRNGFDKYLNDLIRVSGKQEVLKFLESKLGVKFIEIDDFLNKTSINCKTCNLIIEAKESIKLYKKDYSKYNTKEKLSCSVVRTAYDSNLKRTTSQTTYRKTILKHCPECGKKL